MREVDATTSGVFAGSIAQLLLLIESAKVLDTHAC